MDKHQLTHVIISPTFYYTQEPHAAVAKPIESAFLPMSSKPYLPRRIPMMKIPMIWIPMMKIPMISIM